MTNNQESIIEKIVEYLTLNPGIRFTQALFNLGINEFAEPKQPEVHDYMLRDPYNDSDEEVLKRININSNEKDIY